MTTTSVLPDVGIELREGYAEVVTAPPPRPTWRARLSAAGIDAVIVLRG